MNHSKPSSAGRMGRGVLVVAGLSLLAACGGRRAPEGAAAPASNPGRGGDRRTASAGPEFDPTRLYNQMGMLATAAPMPFVGGVSFLASGQPDSTNVTLALSLTNAALAFARDNDRFVAGYTVQIGVRQGSAEVQNIEAHESVRIASYKETGRIDESVVFQQGFTLAPGQYAITVTVRDDGSGRTSTQEMLVGVPRLGAGRGVSSPVAYHRVVSRTDKNTYADLVVNPRASAVFGRDSAIALYVEGYGDGASLPVRLEARSDNGRVLWRDSLSLQRRGNLYPGIVRVPVAKVGIGAVLVSMWTDGAGAIDTMRAPVFVGFGEELPVAKFEDMLLYLRWYASGFRIKQLRDAPPEERPAAWARFVKETDTSPLTPANEELRDYFIRLLLVAGRYREEGSPGWLTDRGKVYLGLGEPDQIFDQAMTTLGDRGRAQVWEYRGMNMQLVFYDQTGFGRWRLTNASELEFQSQWQRRVNH